MLCLRLMIQFEESVLLIEEEAPPLEIAMPQVTRRPAAPAFARENSSVARLITQARQAHQSGDRPAFGKAYGELIAEFQPGVQWALSCWEYLLSTEGCRFLARSEEERQFHRGDYRVFTENDFRSLVHQSFKKSLISYLEGRFFIGFPWYLKQAYWLTLLKSYRALEKPPNPFQRRLTAYSYLRCAPYQFLNPYHQERVYERVAQLPAPQRRVVELYYLHFYKEAAVLETAEMDPEMFRRLRSEALGSISSSDTLSFVLLNQIERY